MPTSLPSKIDMALAADLLAAMANEKRMLILDIISKEEVSVGRLAFIVGITQSAISQHLSKLKDAKLVQTRRDAQTIYYKSDSEEVRLMLAALYEIFVLEKSGKSAV